MKEQNSLSERCATKSGCSRPCKAVYTPQSRPVSSPHMEGLLPMYVQLVSAFSDCNRSPQDCSRFQIVPYNRMLEEEFLMLFREHRADLPCVFPGLSFG